MPLNQIINKRPTNERPVDQTNYILSNAAKEFFKTNFFNYNIFQIVANDREVLNIQVYM